MAQRDEIKALQDEIAELRRQLSALAVAMTELAVQTPPAIQYVPYVPAPAMLQPWPWWNPTITYSTSSGHPNMTDAINAGGQH